MNAFCRALWKESLSWFDYVILCHISPHKYLYKHFELNRGSQIKLSKTNSCSQVTEIPNELR